jgi:predicted ATPase/class 3 adenylate cyclase
MTRHLPNGTVTFLFTDIEGSTRLLDSLGAEAYGDALAEHRQVIRTACSAQGGVEVDTQGDALFFAFAAAPRGLAAARAITTGLAVGPIRVRIGLHTGTPLVTEEGYVGADVHRAARIAAAGHGGQVLISSATASLLIAAGLEPEAVPLHDLGEYRLKDIAGPVSIYQLGEGSFPPLRTISNTNLPRPASSFVGRDRELADVLSKIGAGARLITFTGPGGSGKTRLALEAAAKLVPRYKAGVFWIGLAGLRDPSLVTETISQTLGAKGGLAEHVGERELLLLLDNMEQVIGAASELSALLTACPNLMLLVTSRELLRVRGEIELQVPPLPVRDAVSLFCQRAQVDPSEEIGELCRRLDSLPLAVELAAARARTLSPAQILERLSQRLDLLRGGRDADARQQTLRATIDWSYDLLFNDEKQLFRRLSVFAGGWTVGAAEEVTDADIDTMQSLVAKSLVRFSRERYWMLETIREFAADALEGSSESRQANERHAQWFVRLVERAVPELEGRGQDAWFDRLEEEHDNIRAALRWAANHAEGNLSLRLAGSSATFWWVRGHWTEGRRWLEGAISQPGAQDRGLRGRALEGAAHLAYRQRDYSRAEGLAGEAFAIARELDDASRTARSLRVLGLIASGMGDDQRFRVLIEQSAEFARDSGDVWALLMALNNLGYLALAGGDPEQAATQFEEALQLASGREDQRSEAFLLENLALAKLEQGMIGQARDDFVRSLRLAHRLGYVEVASEDLLGIAAVATAAGGFDDAARLLGGARRLRAEIGSGFDEVEAKLESRTVAAIEESFDVETFGEALAAGRGLDLDELVDFATRGHPWMPISIKLPD